MRGPSVRWRDAGHQLHDDGDLLRFDVIDINRIIRSAVGSADLYRIVQDGRGHPADWQVLTLSCFALTPTWDPLSLAQGTGFGAYRLTQAGVLRAAGYELWPTEVFADGVPDPRNEVHFDLVVAAGPGLVTTGLTGGTPAERRAAREILRPRFEQVLALLGDPISLPALPGSAGYVQ